MIQLEVFGESTTMAAVAESLERLDGISRVRSVSATRPGHALVAGLVRPRAVDPLLDELDRLGVPDSEITLSRVEAVGQMVGGAAETTLVWADVLSAAWHHARPIGRYFALMLVAGVIAAYGVTERNGILIVGAMAVSPDLLPITAISVGVVGRSPRLVGEAFITLVLGLIGTCAAADGWSPSARTGSICSHPASPWLMLPRRWGAWRPSTTRRSPSRWLRESPACWRSKLAPARRWGWRSPSPPSRPPPISGSRPESVSSGRPLAPWGCWA